MINRIIIPKDDYALVGVEIYDHQPDGLFRYFPQEGDEIKLELYNESEEHIMDVDADWSDPERIAFNVDTSVLEKGSYRYDVIIKTIDEDKPHHIAIKEKLDII